VTLFEKMAIVASISVDTSSAAHHEADKISLPQEPQRKGAG